MVSWCLFGWAKPPAPVGSLTSWKPLAQNHMAGLPLPGQGASGRNGPEAQAQGRWKPNPHRPQGAGLSVLGNPSPWACTRTCPITGPRPHTRVHTHGSADSRTLPAAPFMDKETRERYQRPTIPAPGLPPTQAHSLHSRPQQEPPWPLCGPWPPPTEPGAWQTHPLRPLGPGTSPQGAHSIPSLLTWETETEKEQSP